MMNNAEKNHVRQLYLLHNEVLKPDGKISAKDTEWVKRSKYSKNAEIRLMACSILVRQAHGKPHFSLIKSLERLCQEKNQSVPFQGNLLFCLGDIRGELLVRSKIIKSYVYNSAIDPLCESRCNTTDILEHLAKIGDKRAVLLLKRMLEDLDPSVKKNAEITLKKL